jgi:prophage maintenance system killer protein
VVAATFLQMNGYRLEANQLEIVTTMTEIADHTINRSELVDWMQRNSVSFETLQYKT